MPRIAVGGGGEFHWDSWENSEKSVGIKTLMVYCEYPLSDA